MLFYIKRYSRIVTYDYNGKHIKSIEPKADIYSLEEIMTDEEAKEFVRLEGYTVGVNTYFQTLSGRLLVDASGNVFKDNAKNQARFTKGELFYRREMLYVECYPIHGIPKLLEEQE